MNLSPSSPGPFSERKFSLPEWMAARWRWLFSWSGRISSASYLYAWLFYGVCMGTLVFSGYWAAVDGSIHPRFVVTAEHGINLACLSAAMLVPCMGLVFRRLRDLDLDLLWAVPVYAASLGCAETGFYHVYGWARAAAGGNASLLIGGAMFFCMFLFCSLAPLALGCVPGNSRSGISRRTVERTEGKE